MVNGLCPWATRYQRRIQRKRRVPIIDSRMLRACYRDASGGVLGRNLEDLRPSARRDPLQCSCPGAKLARAREIAEHLASAAICATGRNATLGRSSPDRFGRPHLSTFDADRRYESLGDASNCKGRVGFLLILRVGPRRGAHYTACLSDPARASELEREPEGPARSADTEGVLLRTDARQVRTRPLSE
jgi:hypothetical protein